MSFRFILRLSMLVILGLAGWALGNWVEQAELFRQPPLIKGEYHLIAAIIGAALGFMAGPFLILRPLRHVYDWVANAPSHELFMGLVGVALGLVLAALLTLPLAMLPGMWGHIMPAVFAVLLASLGATLMIVRDRDMLSLLGVFASSDTLKRKRSLVLLDTSVIIDGRVADICQSGFVSGTMIVPRFVLEELQHIADSPDVLRRNRGRRGLDILNKMQQDGRIHLEISELDVPDTREVDGKLVKLARRLDCPILTNDYNLNRVAELQGVQVLNINELANAVKAIVLPGETLRVHIIQEGKESGQGVGYLDDGTMIVVEEGRRYMNNTIDVAVTRVLQTVAGRMIFGQPQDGRR